MEASAALHHQAPTLPERAPASARARTPPPLRPPPEKRARAPAQPAQALRCPRCDSANTKFCYYNNYSLAQPRYFCKGCRRYWTHGGSLRNVPVGGGNRKNKKPPASASGRTPPHYNPAAAAGGSDLTAAPVSLCAPLALPPGLLEFLGSGSLGSGYRGPCGDAEAPLLPFGEVGGGLQYWQVGGAEAAGLEAVDGGRGLWGYAGSDWHGLINGALLQ